MHASAALAPQYSNYAAGIPAQPMTGIPAHPMTSPHGEWSTGLCGCGEDCSNCCLTCWCPCISFGQVAEILDKGTTSCAVHGCLYTLLLFTRCHCLYSFAYRSKMRTLFNLPEQPFNDCLVHCWCEYCSLCQMHRELKHQGYKPSLGWNKQNQEVMMPPVRNPQMKR